MPPFQNESLCKTFYMKVNWTQEQKATMGNGLRRNWKIVQCEAI